MAILYRYIVNDYVKRWQEDLNRAGHNAGKVDGKFGPKTLAASRKALGARSYRA